MWVEEYTFHHEVMHAISRHLNKSKKNYMNLASTYELSNFSTKAFKQNKSLYRAGSWHKLKQTPIRHITRYSAMDAFEDMCDTYAAMVTKYESKANRKALRDKTKKEINNHCDGTLMRKVVFIKKFLSKNFPKVFTQKFWDNAKRY